MRNELFIRIDNQLLYTVPRKSPRGNEPVSAIYLITALRTSDGELWNTKTAERAKVGIHGKIIKRVYNETLTC